jgi:transcriptional regulator with XRE-family HTH domain
MDPASDPESARLAGRVRLFRGERGWTQAQLARKAGLSAATVSRIERGDERPLGRTATALARALGVEPDRLLGLEGQPPLFPLPDQRRIELVRRVLALDDAELEAAHPRVLACLEAVAHGRPARARSRKSKG